MILLARAYVAFASHWRGQHPNSRH